MWADGLLSSFCWEASSLSWPVVNHLSPCYSLAVSLWFKTPLCCCSSPSWVHSRRRRSARLEDAQLPGRDGGKPAALQRLKAHQAAVSSGIPGALLSSILSQWGEALLAGGRVASSLLLLPLPPPALGAFVFCGPFFRFPAPLGPYLPLPVVLLPLPFLP